MIPGMAWIKTIDYEQSDGAQVIAYFNYINRIADGLGVDLEDSMPPDPRDAG
jgi:hypothetical protein